MRALYATGRFADLQVEAQRDQRNQLSLVFVATENLFIGSVTVFGAPRRPSGAQLRDTSKLELGKLYSPAGVERAIQRMKSLLADNGYHEAVVTVTEERHPETQQINIHFSVTPGRPAKLGQVIVTGSPGLSDAEILRISKLRPGQTVSAEHITRALSRLRKQYSKSERLEAQISVVERRYHAENNTLEYVFRVVRGPVVDISVAGADISQGQAAALRPGIRRTRRGRRPAERGPAQPARLSADPGLLRRGGELHPAARPAAAAGSPHRVHASKRARSTS